MSNLLVPLRRDQKLDFASGTGDDLLASKGRLVLGTIGASGTSYGEIPWRTSFGSPLQLLRHKNNAELLVDLADTYAREALERWLPGVEVTTSVERVNDALRLRVKLRRGSASAEVELPLTA